MSINACVNVSFKGFQRLCECYLTLVELHYEFSVATRPRREVTVRLSVTGEGVRRDMDCTDGATSKDAVERLVACISGEPLYREIYVGVLEFCKERRDLSEVEAAVQSWPQFSQAAQSPYRLVRNLVELGGLDWIELDDEGVEVNAQRKVGLTPDEVDDLVASFAVQTTADGADAAEEMSPARRFRKLEDEHADRVPVFNEILELCMQPRSFSEIALHLEERGLLDVARAENGQALHPSYFVDALERAGALVWDGAWKTRCLD